MTSTIDKEIRQKIVEAIRSNRQNYDTDTKHAVALGIPRSTYSTIKNGDTDRKLKDADWIAVARKLGVVFGTAREWRIAETPTFKYIYTQLEKCQKYALSSIFCDLPDIGKTTTAKYYAKNNRFVVYVDCSQVKQRRNLLRFIAREFGVHFTGRYVDVYDDLVYYLNSIPNPLVILDEVGDLQYEAFLELKALWNATPGCGWYMMGATGLRAKLQRGVDNEKVGFEEIVSRYGNKFNRSTPEDSHEREEFLLYQAQLIAKANAAPGMDVNKIARQSAGSGRRVYTIIAKQTNPDE